MENKTDKVEHITIVGEKMKFYRDSELTSKEEISTISFWIRGMDNLKITLSPPKEK